MAAFNGRFFFSAEAGITYALQEEEAFKRSPPTLFPEKKGKPKQKKAPNAPLNAKCPLFCSSYRRTFRAKTLSETAMV